MSNAKGALHVCELRKRERKNRSVINPSPRGDPNILGSSKSFVKNALSLDTFVRSAKKKEEENEEI